MASFDTSRPAYGSTSAVSGLFAFISGCFAAAIAWNDARVTRNALASLSDRELADIGLERCDIDSVIGTDLMR